MRPGAAKYSSRMRVTGSQDVRVIGSSAVLDAVRGNGNEPFDYQIGSEARDEEHRPITRSPRVPFGRVPFPIALVTQPDPRHRRGGGDAGRPALRSRSRARELFEAGA